MKGRRWFLTSYAKIKSRWLDPTCEKNKTITLLEENTREYPFYFELMKNFLKLDRKALNMKDSLIYIKMNFYSSKDNPR